uniref:Uncharacterized protein n=1 Tax=Cacopsylla melanoneura TaxID=428564 RepID=A0A8D8SFS1_9HEMI
MIRTSSCQTSILSKHSRTCEFHLQESHDSLRSVVISSSSATYSVGTTKLVNSVMYLGDSATKVVGSLGNRGVSGPSGVGELWAGEFILWCSLLRKILVYFALMISLLLLLSYFPASSLNSVLI